MDLVTHLSRLFNVEPGVIVPQQHSTSKSLQLLKAVPVKLLVGPLYLPLKYTQKCVPAKRQPAPLNIGDVAYVKLQVDGLVNIYPFSLADSGYELVCNAIEGTHYTFM